MSENLPKISVIIRAFNPKEYINKSIDGALSQSLPADFFEIIIVDDGSDFGIESLLSAYKGKLRIIRQEHAGPVKAANFGVKNSKGKYIIFLDSDDCFENSALEKMLKEFEKDGEVSFVYSDYIETLVNGQSKTVSLKDNIFFGLAAGIMFKKKDMEDVGCYDENFIFAEYDILKKLQQKNYKSAYIPEPLYFYNRKSDSLTANKETVQKALKQLYDKYGDIKIRDY